MPLAAIIPAVIGAGAAIYSANAAGKAQDKALSAQNTSSAQAIAAQQAALDRITGLNQPFINAGASALPGLASRVGAGAPNFSAPSYALPQPGGTPAPSGVQQQGEFRDQGTPVPEGSLGFTGKTGNGASVLPASAGPPSAGATPQATGPDWDAYIAANPDVAAWIQQGHGDPSLGPNQTPEQAAAFQYKNTGQSEGRQLPMTAPSAGATPQTQAPPQPLNLGTASPVVANYTRPNQPAAPTFGPSPDQANFFNPSGFTTSPGYQFRLDQGLRNTNASFGARGLLQSGSALQGFNDYAQNAASAEYGNWWNQQQQRYQDAASQYNTDRASGLNQFNQDRNNLNQNFADDRSYGTNLAVNNRDFANSQYNTQTANMFQLAGVGAQAAGNVAGAVTNNANNSSNLFQTQGNNAANAALANGSTNAQLGGALGGIATNLFNGPSRFGNSFTSAPVGSQASAGFSAAGGNQNFNFGPI